MDTNVLKLLLQYVNIPDFRLLQRNWDIRSLQFLHRLNNWKRNLMSGCLTVIIIKSILRKGSFSFAAGSKHSEGTGENA